MPNAIRLDSSNTPLCEGCTGARLSLSSDSAGVLTLSFSGAGPSWVEFMAPVLLYHRGRLLFAGRVVNYSRTNSAGAVSAEVQVMDFRWLLEQQTFGAQLAAAKEGLADSGSSSGSSSAKRYYVVKSALGLAANRGSRSWHALAAACALNAPGWAPESDAISLDVSRARLAFSGPDYSDKSRGVSAWTVLRDMQTANPDCSYRVDYATATIQVISATLADSYVWDTDGRPITGLDTIEPRYDRQVDGVVIFVTYTNSQGKEKLITRSVPGAIPETASRVPSFSSSADSSTRALLQATHLQRQAAAYMDAVNLLQWGGTLSTRIADADSSLVACRLSVVGPGTRPEWATMGTVVSAEEWDFAAGTRTLTLGKEWQDPSLSALQWDPARDTDGPEGGDDGGDGGGGDDKDKEDKEEYLTVYLTEKGDPTPSADGKLQTRTLVLHASDPKGRDISNEVHYRLVVDDLELPLIDEWEIEAPQNEVEVTLPSGENKTAHLVAAKEPPPGSLEPAMTTDPENEYTAELLWGNKPDSPDPDKPDPDDPDNPDDKTPLEVRLGEASMYPGIGPITVHATVTKHGVEYTDCTYIWTVTEPCYLPNGYEHTARLEAALRPIDGGYSEKEFTVYYTLTVIDRKSGATTSASGSYTNTPDLPELEIELVGTSMIENETFTGNEARYTFSLTCKAKSYGRDVTSACSWEYQITNNTNSWWSSIWSETAPGSFGGNAVMPQHTVITVNVTARYRLSDGSERTASQTVTIAEGVTGGGDGGCDTLTDPQRLYNLYIYVHQFGYEFGYTSYPYYHPSVFPSWIWGMTAQEIEQRLFSERERN